MLDQQNQNRYYVGFPKTLGLINLLYPQDKELVKIEENKQSL